MTLETIAVFTKAPLFLQNGSRWQIFQDALNPDQENLDLANINLMLELLIQKKKQLEAVRRAHLYVFHITYLLEVCVYVCVLENVSLCDNSIFLMLKGKRHLHSLTL